MKADAADLEDAGPGLAQLGLIGQAVSVGRHTGIEMQGRYGRTGRQFHGPAVELAQLNAGGGGLYRHAPA